MRLLSICIPTYNRKDRLEKLLIHLCENRDPKVDILVFDNSSKDGTFEMIQFYIKTYNIKYYRNEKNIGIDRNMLKMAREGKKNSEYSLWLGDDDYLDGRFFSEVPKKLETQKSDLIVLNSKSYINNFFRRMLSKLRIKSKTNLNIKEDKIENDVYKFFENYVFKLPFGVIIIKNSRLNLDNAERYLDTYHLYSALIWEYLSEKFESSGVINVLVTAYPYIVWGIGDKTYKDIEKEVCIGIGKWNALLPEKFRGIVDQKIVEIADKNLFGVYSFEIRKTYNQILGRNCD